MRCLRVSPNVYITLYPSLYAPVKRVIWSSTAIFLVPTGRLPAVLRNSKPVRLLRSAAVTGPIDAVPKFLDKNIYAYYHFGLMHTWRM